MSEQEGRNTPEVRPSPGADTLVTQETNAPSPDAEARVAAGYLVGTKINGRYVVHEVLGQGGMGVVFRTTDTVRGRDVALKVIRSESISAEQLAFFRQEFQTLAKLRHPNIACVHDFETIEGGPHVLLTMDLVDGTHLRLASEGLDVAPITELLVQVCRTLAYLHSRQITHFDIKPENILVGRDGQVKLVDFGLARFREGGDSRRLRGTLAFMAPEILLRRPVDHRADLYSLGITMYAVLCKALPFASANAAECLELHSGAPILFDGEAAARVPGWLQRIILRLTAKDPADRFHSANAVIQQVNADSGSSYALETQETRESYILSSLFVGRDAELERLVSVILDHTRGGADERRGVAVLVSGQSGIGKSRLLREVRHHVQLEGTPFVEASCYSSSQADYGAIAEALPQLVSLARARGRIDIATRYGAALARVHPHLHEGLPHEPWPSLGDPTAERARLLEEITALFLDVADLVPYALCFHDLHVADPASVEVIDLLVRRLGFLARARRPTKIAVLGSVRDDEVQGSAIARLLSAPSLVEVVELRPLTRVETGAQLGSMFGIDVPAAFVDRVAHETAGNPYFVEEVTRALVDRGLVFIENGAWSTAEAIAELEIPKSIKAAFLHRAGFLDAGHRAVLDCLAVCGHPVAPAVLQHALQLSAEALTEGLAHLGKRRMAEVSAEGGEPRCRAAHDRVTESLYQSMSDEQRRRIHRRLAAAIESVHAGDRAAHVFELARHHLHGGDLPRAMAASIEAGDQARARYAHAVAKEMYERALALHEEIGASVDQRAEILERVADATTLLGESEHGIEQLREVLARKTDPTDRARLQKKIGDALCHVGARRDAELEIWKAVTLLGGYREPGLVAALARFALEKVVRLRRPAEPAAPSATLERARLLSSCYLTLAELASSRCDMRAEILCMTASSRAARHGDLRARWAAERHLVLLDIRRGRYDRAMNQMPAVMELATALGDVAMVGRTRLTHTVGHHALGQWREVVRVGKDAVEELRSCGDIFEIGDAQSLVGAAFCQLGDLQEALRWTEPAARLVERVGSFRLSGLRASKHADVLIALGRFPEAEQEIDRLHELVGDRTRTERALSVVAELAWGRLRLAQGRLAEAIEHLSRSLDGAREFTYEGLLPFELIPILALLARAKLRQILGEPGFDLRRDPARWKELSALMVQIGQAIHGTPAFVTRDGWRITGKRYSRTFPAENAPGHLALGMFHWVCGERERAGTSFQASLDAARAQGAKLLEAETLTEMARCYQASGEGEAARRHGEAAAALYRDMESTGGTERVQAALGNV